MSRGQAGWKSRARKFADLLASNGMIKNDKVNYSTPAGPAGPTGPQGPVGATFSKSGTTLYITT